MRTLSYYLCAAHWRSYFSKEHWKGWIFDTLFSGLFAIYGAAAGLLWNIGSKQEIGRPGLVWAITCFAALAPAMLTLLFSGPLRKFDLSRHYPLNKYEQASLQLLTDGMLKSANLFIIIGLACLWAIGRTIPLSIMTGFYVFFAAGIVVKENLANCLGTGKKWGWISVLILALLLALDKQVLDQQALDKQLAGTSHLWLAIGTLLTQLVVYFGAWRPNTPTRSGSSFINDPFLNLLWQNHVYRKTFLTGVLFKIGALLYVTLMFRYKLSVSTTSIPIVSFVLNALYLPLLTFTYAFNNTWGYFRSLALTLSIGGATARDYLMYLQKLVRAPLLLDFFLGTLTLWAAGLLELKELLFYAVFCLYAIQVALLSSFYCYAWVSEGLSFKRLKGNTPIGFNLLTLAGIIPLSLVSGFDARSALFLSIPLLMTLTLYTLNRHFAPFLQRRLQHRLLKNTQI